MKNWYQKFTAALLVAVFVMPLFVFGEDFSSSNFQVQDPVMEGLGSFSTSTNFQVQGTIPYISTTIGTSTSFVNKPGFEAYTTSTIALPVVSAIAGTLQAEISWTAASGLGGPFTYEVGLSTTPGGPYTFEASQASLNLTKTGLSGGVTYYIVVRASDAASTVLGLSGQISVVPIAEVVAPTPAAPSGGGFPFFIPIFTGLLTNSIIPGASDIDQDGIPDSIECPVVTRCADTDFDGVADYLDADDDNDGILTGNEGTIGDADQDGIPDYLDPSYGTIEDNAVIPQDDNVPPPFRDIWNLLPEEKLDQLIDAGVLEEFSDVTTKYPNLLLLFGDVDFNKPAGLSSLELPGYEVLYNFPLSLARLDSGPNDYLRSLTQAEKDALPTDSIFLRSTGGSLDLLLGQKILPGKENQSLLLPTDYTVEVFLKPVRTPLRVIGYLIYEGSRLGISGGLLSSAYAQSEKTGVVLEEFGYTDLDLDGIYEGKFLAPPLTGEYRIVTKVEYGDESEDAIYEVPLEVVKRGSVFTTSLKGRDFGLPGAVVLLEQYSEATQTFVRFKAEDFLELNPQQSDNLGEFLFVAPPGKYRLKVSKDRYVQHEGRPFVVGESTLINPAIHLRLLAISPTIDALMQLAFWLLVVVLGLLMYVYAMGRKERQLTMYYH